MTSRAEAGATMRDGAKNGLGRLRRMRDAIRRSFREFLALPTFVIAAFLALAVLMYLADRSTPAWLQPTRAFLQQHAFTHEQTTSDVLGSVAGGIITVTSIIVSVLLLAVQQSASSMSTAVFDQFLRRRENQFSFGFFIGLALYTLLTLGTVHEHSNAVLGATLAFLLTVIALFVLLALLYSTVNQMRPSIVVGSIARLTLRAREKHATFLSKTRRQPGPRLPARRHVTATESGYVTAIDLARLERALRTQSGEYELVLLVATGTFVAFGQPIAVLHSRTMSVGNEGAASAGSNDVPSFDEMIRSAIHLEADRDIAGDPAFGIEQIHTIGWTSVSSAKSNPAPGYFVVDTLVDLLARWSEISTSPEDPLPIVYADQTTALLFETLESLGVAASESKQHQSLARVLLGIASLVGRLPADERQQAADVVQRLLPSVSGHVHTRTLHTALRETATCLEAAGERQAAAAVRAACERADAESSPGPRARDQRAARG